MNESNNSIKAALLFAGILLSGLPAAAADASWTGLGADSAWTTAGNWSASPVPGAGDTATFNGAGNGKTVITTAPAGLTRYLFDTAACTSYTISAPTTTWSIPAGGGVSISGTVSAGQDLTGIQYTRPTVNSTAHFDNQGGGTLKLGTIFSQNAGSGTTLAQLDFTPARTAAIEVAYGKLLDNAGTGGRCKMSVLLDDDGVLKIAAVGSYDGTDVEGNSVTIHRGSLMARVIGVIGTARTSLGANGRIQFGEAGLTRTATLDYYDAANATTDRSFHIIDDNTAVFRVSGGAATSLQLTSGITQSGSANGGGRLTKEGAGTLILSGSSTYSGDTTVSAGTLELTQDQCLSTNTAVVIADGAVLNLDFTGTNTVRSLQVGGVLRTRGVYGASHVPGLITGTGFLRSLEPAERGTVMILL